jgi:hypothetical protein
MHPNTRLYGLSVALLVTACGESAQRPDAGGSDAAVVVEGGPRGPDAEPGADLTPRADAAPTSDANPVGPDAAGSADAAEAPSTIPRAVRVARATRIPACDLHVDARAVAPADGSALAPYATIAAAVAAAAPGATICVAEGVYPESIVAGTLPFSLAGGFRAGSEFRERDSARYVSRAQGSGRGSFVSIVDEGPRGAQLLGVDGFEITGYAQAILRDVYYSQQVSITNNYLHDNRCDRPDQAGAAFSLSNVSGTIAGNVIARNTCARGGGGALFDGTDENSVALVSNWVDENVGDEPDTSHGGGWYLFGHQLSVVGNLFTGNRVTGWGGGLYVGAFTAGGEHTAAALSWNVYRDNRAGNMGGGFFCDDGAQCTSAHELYADNCGGNILVDCGPDDADATIAAFDHMTNVRAKTPDCSAPGSGVIMNKSNPAADLYTITNSIFWGNAPGADLSVACATGCAAATFTVRYSAVQRRHAQDGFRVTFGDGILDGVDPLFAGQDDLHLRSTRGRWTTGGVVTDAVDSPLLGAADPRAPVVDQPVRAGARAELGVYGNSAEASLTR